MTFFSKTNLKKGDKVKVQSLNDKTSFFETHVLKEPFLHDGRVVIIVYGIQGFIDVERIWSC
jgi:hypothetical protein